MGSIKKEVSYNTILAFTMPAIISVALEPMAEAIDTSVLGHINTVWVGSLATTNACLGSFAWIFNFLSYGVSAQISHSVGAKQKDALGRHIITALVMALFIGALVGTLLYLFGQTLLTTLMGARGELLSESKAYYSIRVIGYPLTILSIAMIGILRGLQKISLTLLIVAITTITNALGTYFAVFHYDLGIKGAAFATVISFLLSDCVALIWLYMHRHEYGLDKRWQVKYSDIMALGSDGINLGLRTGMLTFSFFIITSFATRLGTTVVAAHQVALQAWLLAAYFIDGLAITATSFGGELLGKGDIKSHRLLSHRLIVLSMGLGMSFFFIYYFAKDFIQGLFTNQKEIINHLGTIWIFISASQVINAIAYTYDGILFGAKDFVFLRKRMIEGFLFVFLPLSFWGYIKLESLLGLWIAIIGLNIYRLISGFIGCKNI